MCFDWQIRINENVSFQKLAEMRKEYLGRIIFSSLCTKIVVCIHTGCILPGHPLTPKIIKVTFDFSYPASSLVKKQEQSRLIHCRPEGLTKFWCWGRGVTS